MATLEQQFARQRKQLHGIAVARVRQSRTRLEQVGDEVMEYARLTATWQDRSGDARRGLVSIPAHQALQELNGLIYLASLVFYGKYLEFNHGSRFAILQVVVAMIRERLRVVLQETWT